MELDPENWRVNPKPSQTELPNHFFTATYGSDFKKMQWAICCLDNSQLELREALIIQSSKYLKQVQGVDRRMVVTSLPLTPALKDLAERTCLNLIIADSNELLRSSIDFSEYDNKLIRQYRGGDQFNTGWIVPPLAEVYTLLQCEERFLNIIQIDEKAKIRGYSEEDLNRLEEIILDT